MLLCFSYYWCVKNKPNLMVWNNHHLIMVRGSVAQGFGWGTAGVACLCSAMPGTSGGRTQRLGMTWWPSTGSSGGPFTQCLHGDSKKEPKLATSAPKTWPLHVAWLHSMVASGWSDSSSGSGSKHSGKWAAHITFYDLPQRSHSVNLTPLTLLTVYQTIGTIEADTSLQIPGVGTPPLSWGIPKNFETLF